MAEEKPLVETSVLLAFRAENVRSFRGPVELSLLATPLAEEGVPRLVPWREDGRPIRVLPAVGIFGANASGKSNLLRAMHDMPADLSPRADEAIERRYRTGRHGATPILTTEEFAEAALNAAGE